MIFAVLAGMCDDVVEAYFTPYVTRVIHEKVSKNTKKNRDIMSTTKG